MRPFILLALWVLAVTVTLLPPIHFHSSDPISPYRLSISPQTPEEFILLGVPISINHALANTLQVLPFIGPSRADAIVAYRESSRFNTPEELVKVHGIGQKTLDRIRPFISVD